MSYIVNPVVISGVLDPHFFVDSRRFFIGRPKQLNFNLVTGLDIQFSQVKITKSSRSVLRGPCYHIQKPQDKSNSMTVKTACTLVDEQSALSDVTLYDEQITIVSDRPGHNGCYAFDATKINPELCLKLIENFESGIRRSVQWYLDNSGWLDKVQTGPYLQWFFITTLATVCRVPT
jgi:hypothetical protein